MVSFETPITPTHDMASSDVAQLLPDEMWQRLDATADTEEQWLDGQASYLRQRMAGRDDRIGKIGAGVQYVVYELPNDRVFKVAQTPMSARNKNQLQGGDDEELPFILRYREDSADYVEKLTADYPRIAPLFGNPRFNGGHDSAGAIEQDKATVLGVEGFSRMSPGDQINYIRGYVAIIKHCWTYGCSDRTMNVQVNTGLNKNGEIILTDFGELDITKEDARATIRERRWKTQWGINQLTDEVKARAFEIFDSELTVAQLDALWGAKL